MMPKACLFALFIFLLSPEWVFSQNIRSLEDIFLNLEDGSEILARNIAEAQSKEQWKMDKGPLYKSTPPKENRDPKIASDDLFFEGYFIPSSNLTVLAIFSDDGCNVWIDGKLVHDNFMKPQHLPSLPQSFHVLKGFQPIAGQLYHFKIHYSNTIFLGKTDIDGCTLFAFNGGGKVFGKIVDIIGDIDRDGKIDEDKDNTEKEKTVGTLVIANLDDVYSDSKDTALRREILVKNRLGPQKVSISRKGEGGKKEKLHLFSKPLGGPEIFGDTDEIEILPGTYWLQGGTKPSAKTRDQWLKVRKDKNSKDYDSLTVTVLWAEIETRTKGLLSDSPIFEGNKYVKKTLGHILLGVHRPLTKNATDYNQTGTFGSIEITGLINPTDLKFDNKITTNFRKEPDGNATADFGFVFRRTAANKSRAYYIPNEFNDYLKIKAEEKKDHVDDSDIQDVNPDILGENLVVTDFDAPGQSFGGPTNIWGSHLRQNFSQHLSFCFHKGKLERCSKVKKWAFSLDHAINYEKKSVCIDGHFDLSKIEGPSPKIAKDGIKKEQKSIKRGEKIEVLIKGVNLYGTAYLEKGKDIIGPLSIQLKETYSNLASLEFFSDSTEMKLIFHIAEPAGDGYHLVIKNIGGEEKISGFRIVD